MCGIFCCVIKNDINSKKSTKGNILEALCRRGPDNFGENTVTFDNCWTVNFAASVLWMQGRELEKQPGVHSSGNVLLWNGDIFNGELASDGNISDTRILFEKLIDSSDSYSIIETILKVRGPYAFIYWDSNNRCLWFGRDRIGRHSLLWNTIQDDSVTICSVADRKSLNYNEVPSAGIFVIDFSNIEGSYTVKLHPWSDENRDKLQQIRDSYPLLEVEDEAVLSPVQFVSHIFKENPSDLELQTYSMLENLPRSEIMDRLLRVTEIKDRVTRIIDTLKEAVKIRVTKQANICKLCANEMFNYCERTDNSEPHNRHVDSEYCKQKCDHTKIGILFSGGIDSAVLAALAHNFVPETDYIDLLNVAFERNKTGDVQNKNRKERRKQKSETCENFNVPDRLSGRQTFEELVNLYPRRKWRFVEINVEQEELRDIRHSRIVDLIYPLNTVLDDSLGCALWFAARGEGIAVLSSGEIVHDYVSPARVVLLGMGADEQLGGYMRHRTILKQQGWIALQNELEMELCRISSRNLGRDDRIVSDHGRQGRYPYLDERVVTLLACLPPWHKTCPVSSMPPGIGDKILLRLAAWELGLKNAANIPKRAFQFGSRIANSKENASDISIRLS